MKWLKEMIRKRLLVRDIESFLKSQEEKLRSEEENIRDEERNILLGLMDIKLKDEKKNYRKLVKNREDMRKMLKKECENSNKKYLTTVRKLRKEVEKRNARRKIQKENRTFERNKEKR